MARQSQNRSTRLMVAIVGSAAMILVAPAGAWADSAHNGYSRHGDHGQHYATSSHHHGSHKQHWAHRGHRGRDYRHGHRDHGYRHGQNLRQHGRHYCKPCGRYFGERDGLYGHVSVDHGVPFWRLSYAIGNYSLGLVFYG